MAEPYLRERGREVERKRVKREKERGGESDRGTEREEKRWEETEIRKEN